MTSQFIYFDTTKCSLEYHDFDMAYSLTFKYIGYILSSSLFSYQPGCCILPRYNRTKQSLFEGSDFAFARKSAGLYSSRAPVIPLAGAVVPLEDMEEMVAPQCCHFPSTIIFNSIIMNPLPSSQTNIAKIRD